MKNTNYLFSKLQFIPLDSTYFIGLSQIKPIKERATQRKQQSLLCRNILQQLLEIQKLPHATIRKDKYNKCHLLGLPYYISFSHSDYWCAAGLHLQNSIGIDIEKISHRPLKIAHKFLQPTEYRLCQNDDFLATAMWCVKEAIYKKYSPHIRHWQKDIQIRKIQTNECHAKVQLGTRIENCQVALCSIDNFILAYTSTTSTELDSKDI